MSRPNPHTRAARARRKHEGQLAALGIKTRPDAVPGLPEAIHLAEVYCPSEACGHALELAYPHPSLPGVLMSKCGGCKAEWKFSPPIVDTEAS